jgi:hypothetical protein
MKTLILMIPLTILSACKNDVQQQVEFQFVNLSTIEIHSDSVIGMPTVIAGGWLPPRTDEQHIDGTVVSGG